MSVCNLLFIKREARNMEGKGKVYQQTAICQSEKRHINILLLLNTRNKVFRYVDREKSVCQ